MLYNINVVFKFFNISLWCSLNFKINPGELIAIVGPVGCGKTTLAKSLGRTIEIPDGQLFLDNVDIKNIKLRDLKDSSRELSPLLPPDDAHLIDSSDMSLEDVFSYAENLIRKEFI
mgnify:CR=1 FL=1